MLNQIKKLNKFNCIKFIDSEHKYLINGVHTKGSITKVLSDCKLPFDTDKWSKYKAEQRGVEQQVVLDEWALNAKFSTHLGTLLHSYIENYWFNKIKKYDQEEVIKLFGNDEHSRMRTILGNFVKTFNGMHKNMHDIIPIRSELIVGDVDNTQVCGTMDLLAYNTTLNAFEIYDYKTNKKFTHSNPYNEKYTNPIVSHMDVCDLNHYSLQQSLYKYIIEKYTDIRIANCYLLWFDRENMNCEKILCKDYTSLCKELLNDYFERNLKTS